MKFRQTTLLKEKRRADRRRLIFIWGLLFLPLLHFCVFWVYTNISSIFLSFQTKMGSFTTIYYENFFKELIYGNGANGHEYLWAILYSFLLGINDVVLVLVSTILAYFMYKKIPGGKAFRILFFLPSIIPITVYVLVYKFLLSPTTGLAGTVIPDLKWLENGTFGQKLTIPMYCLWVGTGYNILVIGGAMSNIPTEVIENAKLEGVGKMRELFDIIIPMIWPTLQVAFIGSITVVFTIFLQVKLITNGAQGTKTIAYIINSLVEGEYTNQAAAIGIIFTIVSIPVVLLVKKLLEKLGKKWGY